MTGGARMLVRLLRDPLAAERLGDAQWTALVAAARSESLFASLAYRLDGVRLPGHVARMLDEARQDADRARARALWEAEMARRALAPVGVPVVLLKGTAFAAAGLAAGFGRSIGDLDILVSRRHLGPVQQALLRAGWEWVKEDRYDDLYYRRWMHELPPLIHKERDRMIDVHHTILPLTARRRPDAAALLADSIPLPDGLRVLSPADMLVHAAAHMLADGDLAGGLRNLWDIDRMIREFRSDPGFWCQLVRRARHHQLDEPVARSLRLAAQLYGTPVDEGLAGRPRLADGLFRRRLLARDGWGRETHRPLRFAFYVRSHLLRMPPSMLARHLWTKARRGKASEKMSTLPA